MSEIANPHDKFFKEVFSHPEIAKDFLFRYLPPEIICRLDPDSIHTQKDSFIEYTLQEQFSDLLFSATLKNRQDLYIYLLFEHKSHPEPLMAFHLLRYMVKIWENDLKRNPSGPFRWILPLVVYHGKEKWNAADQFSALFPKADWFRSYLPDFRYELFDLSKYEDHEIQGVLQLRTALMLMKYIFRNELREKLGTILRWIHELEKTQNIQEFLITVVLYLMSTVDQMSFAEIQSEMERASSDRGENAMATIAEKLIEKGRQEGWQRGQQEGWQKGQEEGWQRGQQEGWQKGQQEGRQRGRLEGKQEGWQEGKRESIHRILATRFDAVPPEIDALLKRIQDSSTLDQLISASVSVRSPEEFMQILIR